MLLITGPPGSGKTHSILEQVRAMLRGGGGADFRLVVPTATMASHLRNQLAREALPLRPGGICTFSHFIDEWVADIPEMTALELELLVGQALAENCPPEFAASASKKGFRRMAAALIDEFSSAGYESRHVARALGSTPDAPLAPAFLRLYEDVEKRISRQLAVPRHRRLRRAADDIRSGGLGRVRRVFFDGFFSFGDPELNVIQAVCSRADVTVALPRWPGSLAARQALAAMRFETLELDSAAHRFPVRRVVAVPGVDREAAEIARRILDHVEAGLQFREIGIVLRSREPYVPVLRAALERHGIPARFYFAEPLAQHAVVRYLAGAVEAMLGGWKHEDLLALLKMTASGFGGTAACDAFDFAVRENLPGRGLAPLRGLSGSPRLGALLDRLGALECWTALRLPASEWAERVRGLDCLLQAPVLSDGVSHETAALWRARARALAAFHDAAAEAANAYPPGHVLAFQEYWDAFSTVLELRGLHVPDNRRNVVHVMDVYEARQWELPVVFVCGLIEKQFPRYSSADPVFPDATRSRLAAAGIRVATAASARDEEEFLFEVAATRAISEIVFTYPEHDEKGDPNIPSFFIERLVGIEAERCAAPASGGALEPVPPSDPYLHDRRLLDAVARKHAIIGPRAIESFLQCPFRFFLERTLGLEGAPPLARDRLDARVEGSIVHRVLAEASTAPGGLDELFERVFNEVCAAERVPEGGIKELARIRLLRDLRRFLSEARGVDGWTTITEQGIQFPLEEGLTLRGRIDRYDIGPKREAVVFDYKYSGAAGIRERIRGYEDGRHVQAALYLLGLEHAGYVPAGMFYYGLKRDVTLDGWHTSLPQFEGRGTACTREVLRELLESARAAGVAAVHEIRGGRVGPSPAERGQCGFCEYFDVCRAAPSGVPAVEMVGE